MIEIKIFTFNAFQENTFLLYDDTGSAVVVDPGMNSPQEKEVFTSFIAEKEVRLEAILNTHCHFDHVLGCRFLKEKFDIPFLCEEREVSLLENAGMFGEFFGIEVEPPPMPDRYITEGETFRFGNSELRLLLVPGHSPGSLSLYSEKDMFVITGDALFAGSIGRTDLPGGNYQTLIKNIQTKLLTLPRDVAVYPGHGPSTTIGYEHDTNPFLT
jgi:hydroxyacylglutathione hydrolase